MTTVTRPGAFDAFAATSEFLPPSPSRLPVLVADALRRAERSQRRVLLSYRGLIAAAAILGVYSSALAFAAAIGGRAAAFALVPFVSASTDPAAPDWKIVCGIVAALNVAAICLGGLPKALELGDRLKEATERLGALRVIDLRLRQFGAPPSELVEAFCSFAGRNPEFVPRR
ncbi:MAG: hypothetical protein ACXW05_00670 [Gemmatirosa sp.]